MVFKEVNPGFWNYEKDGDFIEGIFLRSEKDVGVNESMLYHLESDGKPVSIWGSTVLDQRMSWVKPGQKIRITFKGLTEKKQGKKQAKIFKVEIDE